MSKRQILIGGAFAIGLFLMAGYTIDNRGFHSGIYGILGSILLVIAYLGAFWPQIKAGDHHARRLACWLAALLGLIIILDIAEALLA